MTAEPIINPLEVLSEQIELAEPDLLRALLKTFVEALMGAEADAVCGAAYGARGPVVSPGPGACPRPRTGTRDGDVR